MRNLPYFLKDEGAFCKTQGDVYGMQGNFDLKLKKSFSSVNVVGYRECYMFIVWF